MGQHILEALFERIEARLCPEGGEVRCPDVCRHKKDVLAGFDTDFDQIPAVQTQNRPAIRLQISDRAQTFIQSLHRGEVGHHDDVVYLSSSAILLVDQADFDGQYEVDVSVTGIR